MIAEDLTVCINLLFKTHPGKSLKPSCSLVMPAKALAVPCIQDYQKHLLTSRRVIAKGSHSVQGHTNGSVALNMLQTASTIIRHVMSDGKGQMYSSGSFSFREKTNVKSCKKKLRMSNCP